MCCFSQPVLSVSDTNLFARMDGESQLLAYQMTYESEVPNAMILPLPVATPADEEDTVEFISLEKYPAFFKDLNKGFPVIRPPSRSRSLGSPGDAVDSQMKLEVVDVGDFEASFVPTQRDFTRLDERFVIPAETWAKLPEYNDYGFAVFQLKELKAKPHPMAFKFKTRHADRLFFPTIHIHDGEVHTREEFDHTLYLQQPSLDEVCGRYQNHDVVDSTTGLVRSKFRAADFVEGDAEGLIDNKYLVHRKIMRGKLKNEDVWLGATTRLGGLPSLQRGLGSAWPALLPLGGIAAATAWLFKRRDQLQGKTPSK